MNDYLTLLNNAIEILRNNELKIAAAKVADALEVHARMSYHCRADTILEINKNIKLISNQLTILRGIVRSLSDLERMFAEIQIENTVEKIYIKELTMLKALKRRMSKPR